MTTVYLEDLYIVTHFQAACVAGYQTTIMNQSKGPGKHAAFLLKENQFN